jgi:hypothetical protein
MGLIVVDLRENYGQNFTRELFDGALPGWSYPVALIVLVQIPAGPLLLNSCIGATPRLTWAHCDYPLSTTFSRLKIVHPHRKTVRFASCL